MASEADIVKQIIENFRKRRDARIMSDTLVTHHALTESTPGPDLKPLAAARAVLTIGDKVVKPLTTVQLPSTNRTKRGGWARSSKLPKGPNGRNLCRQCQVEVEPPRRTFCSDGCVDEWKIRTSPGYARRKVEERDKGICAECSRDCGSLERELRVMARAIHIPEARKAYLAFVDRLVEDGFYRHRVLDRSLWDMDHIKPVVEGGGECGLDNLRTLCIPCHRKETAALRKRLKEAKDGNLQKAGPDPDPEV